MVTAQVLVRLFLFGLLFVDVNGLPVKGSKPQGQNSPSDPHGGDHGGYKQGSGVGYTEPAFHSTSGGFSKPAKAVAQYLGAPQYVQAQPVPVALGSAVPAATDGSLVPLEGGNVAASYLPIQSGFPVPLPAAHAASPPQSGTRPNLPEMNWFIAPKPFEESATDAQPQGMSIVGPPLPPAPPAPVPQSGETSNVVKEAELGNYQQQTEEFGYPSYPVGPGQPLPLVALPSHGVGGLWGYQPPYPLPYPFPYPYPVFDYSLLYGLYPPGTYTTFSRDHEKGKDYYQTTHYLKDHGSAPDTPQNPGSGQQKVYPGVQ